MAIETTVYDLLTSSNDLTDLVGTAIYPTVPTTDTDHRPILIYTVVNAEPQTHTQGVSGLTNYTVQIDCWSFNLDTTTAILAAVKATIHGYRGGAVQGAFLTTQSTIQEEAGYHGTASYTVWSDGADVAVVAQSIGSVRADADGVTISACDHSLTLDCEGLHLDGEAVGVILQSPDSTRWRLTVANDGTLSAVAV